MFYLQLFWLFRLTRTKFFSLRTLATDSYLFEYYQSGFQVDRTKPSIHLLSPQFGVTRLMEGQPLAFFQNTMIKIYHRYPISTNIDWRC